MDNLKNILKELQKIRSELKLQYDDNCLLDCGTRIFNSQNINTDRNNKKISDRGVEPLTDKQRAMLIRLNYNGEGLDRLSKKEAHYLIKELINKNGSKRS